MGIKEAIRYFVRKLGYDITRFTYKHPTVRLKKILQSCGINLVLDVGASIGQTGELLRSINYKGKIVSFEPLSSAYKELLCNTKGDKSWEAHNFALGNKNGKVLINIAGNSYSSSILDMLPSHVKFAPESKYIGQEEIEVKTLDSIFSSLCNQSDNIYLKIDTQGFEINVIKGAEKSLQFIDTIQLEMSLIPLYKNELLYNEMNHFLYQLGYSLISIEPGFSDKDTGRLLQVNGFFHRF